jgi:DNA-binding NtrC family response regulator
LSLLRTIKERDPSVTVIMATGCAEGHSNKEAMRMGALDYLEKPVDIDHLKDIMQSTKLHGPPKPASMLRGGPALLNEAGNSAPA